MDDVRRLLTGIRELLSKYGYDDRAEFVDGLAEGRDSEAFWNTLGGLEFWGGSGAVWEIEPFDLSHPGVADSAVDYRRFQTLMVALVDLLESRGPTPMASRTARLFRRDIEGHS